MHYLFLFLFMLLHTPTQDTMTIDFGEGNPSYWYAVNDGVMGGISQGQVLEKEESMLFTGSISFDNNGGFASVRNQYARYDLSEYSEVEIRYRAKGQNFALQLSLDRRFWVPNYKMPLNPDSEEWQTTTYSLMDFKQSRIGEYTGRTMDEKNLSRIIQMGFINEGKKEGAFELEVDYILFR